MARAERRVRPRERIRSRVGAIHRQPAYRRLLTAEPRLRRAVPALIIAFLLTIGVGAVVQVLDHHRQAITEATHDIDNVADFVSERFDRLAGAEKGDTRRRDLLERALSTRATNFGRRLLLSNAEGVITATAPAGGPIGSRLIDVLGESQPLTILGASAGVLEITIADGSQAFATVRTLSSSPGQLSVYQLRSDALAVWRSDTTLTVTLTATTGFVLLILGFAFHWQGHPRARSRRDLRHGAKPHRHGAQSRPLRDCGTGTSPAAASSGRIRCSRSWASAPRTT
jgi:two-component system cell cycle sensor histidine kinase PleC